VVGADGAPVANIEVSVSQHGRGALELGIPLAASEEVDVSTPWSLYVNPTPVLCRGASTNAAGEYEVFVGLGKHDLCGPLGAAQHVEFEVTDAAERTFNFEMPKPEQPEQPQLMPLAGSVVNRETGRPVAGARLTGVYRYESLATLEVITDEHGAFQTERNRGGNELQVLVTSPDGKLADLLEVGLSDGHDDRPVVFELEPVGSASGQLIDEVTSQPLAGVALRYCLRFQRSTSPGQFALTAREAFGGTATTDTDGSFKITGLVPRQRYYLDVASDAKTSRRLGTVEVKPGENKQLGRLVLAKPKPPAGEKKAMPGNSK
jgi:hypothetical protein